MAQTVVPRVSAAQAADDGAEGFGTFGAERTLHRYVLAMSRPRSPRRRGSTWLRRVLVLVLLSAGAYVAYRVLGDGTPVRQRAAERRRAAGAPDEVLPPDEAAELERASARAARS